MRSEDRATARRQLDRRLSSQQNAELFVRPPRGWLKAIREALGMTTTQLGQRLGVSQSRVVAIEQAESKGSITPQQSGKGSAGHWIAIWSIPWCQDSRLRKWSKTGLRSGKKTTEICKPHHGAGGAGRGSNG